MGFTLSHPAIVLPLKKKNPNLFNLSALIIGSMSPDFQNFIPYISNEFSKIFFPYDGHTLKGIFTFDIPAVIFMTLIFKYIINIPLIFNLPHKIGNNMYFDIINKKKEKTYIFLLKFMISALIGILSHIIWDEFTHPGSVFVKAIPFLKTHIFTIPLCNLLQYITSIVGLIYIMIYLKNNCNKSLSTKYYPNISKRKKLIYWMGIFVSGILAIVPIFSRGCMFKFEYIFICCRNYIVSFMTGFFIGMIIMSFIFLHFLDYKKLASLYIRE